MKTRHSKDELPEAYTYCGITAPLALWKEVGLVTITWAGSDMTEFPYPEAVAFGQQKPASDGDLIEARVRSGSEGIEALVWLIVERRRQAEERARNWAMAEQTAATQKAADEAVHAARIHRQAEEIRAGLRTIRK